MAINSTRTATPKASNEMVFIGLCRPTGMAFEISGGREVVLNGYGHAIAGKDFQPLPDGGFGLTAVPAGDWAEVKAKYGNHPLFLHGLIIENTDRASAEDEAEEKKEVKSGLEAMPQVTAATAAK